MHSDFILKYIWYCKEPEVIHTYWVINPVFFALTVWILKFLYLFYNLWDLLAVIIVWEIFCFVLFFGLAILFYSFRYLLDFLKSYSRNHDLHWVTVWYHKELEFSGFNSLWPGSHFPCWYYLPIENEIHIIVFILLFCPCACSSSFMYVCESSVTLKKVVDRTGLHIQRGLLSAIGCSWGHSWMGKIKCVYRKSKGSPSFQWKSDGF